MKPAVGSAERKVRRDGTINIRASANARSLIERAAAASGSTVTDFMLRSATERATEVLLDQRLFLLDDDEFDKFAGVLDAPAAPNEALQDLLRTPSRWGGKP